MEELFCFLLDFEHLSNDFFNQQLMVLTIGKTLRTSSYILQDLMSRVAKYAGKIRQHVIIPSPKYEGHRRMWPGDNHFVAGMTVGGISY